MIIKYTLNGGIAEVDDELGAELLAGGHWVEHGDDKPARKPRIRAADKVAPADSEE
jgi:hypothetical protein